MPEPKKPSSIEILKENSDYLRGTIKESLAQPTTHFSQNEVNLLKAYGTYQQDNRDQRQQLLKEKKEPAYSMMVRTKVPGGRMSAEQYLAHDDLATKYGNKTLRITTRQGFQFHGVLKKNLKKVIQDINRALVTTNGACGDNVRNVLACPAPITDRKQIEIMKYAKEVSDQFLLKSGAYYEIMVNGESVKDKLPKPGQDPEPIYGKTYLPRKFKIAIAFPGDNCVDAYANDIAIVPEIDKGELQGFNILVGGGFGMTHGIKETYPRLASPFCFVKSDELKEITKAIVLVQRDYGNRSDRKHARLKYLLDDRGLDWFRAEVEKYFGKKLQSAHPVHWEGNQNHLGWHKQENGRWFYGIFVENGRILDKDKMRLKSGLRAAIEKFKPEVHLTCNQDILLSGFTEHQKLELENLLDSYGIILPERRTEIRKNAMACPALPTCGLAITESERVLPSVMDEIEKKAEELGLSGQKIIIRMTGCPNACARPYNAEIAFVGRTVGTYNLYVGGNLIGNRLNFLISDKVSEKDLGKTVGRLLEFYKNERIPGEAFGDFCHRLGAEKICSNTGILSGS